MQATSATVAALLVVVALAGCGGDSGAVFTTDGVEETMTEALRENLPDGTSMSPLDCVRDGDDLHYQCVTTLRQAGQSLPTSIAIVCDPESGRCVTRQG